jgi:hypothetical protein
LVQAEPLHLGLAWVVTMAAYLVYQLVNMQSVVAPVVVWAII